MSEHEPAWQELIKEHETSGLTIEEFCLRRGVNKYTFKKRKYAKERAAPRGPAGFIEVTRRAATLSVKLKNGRSIEVSPGFNESEVQKLVRVLESC